MSCTTSSHNSSHKYAPIKKMYVCVTALHFRIKREKYIYMLTRAGFIWSKLKESNIVKYYYKLK